jgi:hypothetical protein
MLKYVPGIAESIKTAEKVNATFKFILKPTLLTIDNLQFLFLPFRKSSYDEDLNRLSININKNKILKVIAHCPPYKAHEKEYYVMHHEAIRIIREKYGKPFTYFHGHIHSDNTYRYFINSLPNVEIITPKAPDSPYGINWDHDYVEIDTISGDMEVKSIIDNTNAFFQALPDGYREMHDHWNNFVLPT